MHCKAQVCNCEQLMASRQGILLGNAVPLGLKQGLRLMHSSENVHEYRLVGASA
jgi:hypothetical protein